MTSISFAESPKFGLVLSGGGSRGLAHIGVIKVLEKEGYYPDVITGTSMGSVVGGLYAMGYDAPTLEKIAREMDWELMFSDKISRKNIAIEEKEDAERFIVSFPLREGRVSLPRGLIAGYNISNLLSHLTLPVHHIHNFEDLPIPFCCIATDIETGEAVVLKEGYLADAIRASIAVPSVFTPVELDDRLLVDGGIARNLPISDAKEMGANVIIAVDVATPLLDRSQLNSAINIISQTALFQTVANNLEEQQKADILIEPDLGNLAALNFTNTVVDTLIRLGEKAAQEALPQIKALFDSLNIQKKNEVRFIPTTHIDRLYLQNIKIEGLKNVSKELVLSKLQITPPQWITPEELKTSIDRVYGSQFFEQVTYKLEPLNSGGINLVLRVVENQANFLRLGIHYNDYVKSQLVLNVTFRNLLIQGSKFSTDLILGGNPGLNSTYFYYTPWKFAPGAGINIKIQNFTSYLYEHNKRTQELNNRDVSASLVLHSSPMPNAYVRLGIQIDWTRIKPVIGTYPTTKLNLPLTFLRFHHDSYDKRFFPTEGNFIDIQIQRTLKTVTSKDNTFNYHPYSILTIHTKNIITVSKNTALIPSFHLGLSEPKNTPLIHKFYMGGTGIQRMNFIPLYGFQMMEFMGSYLSAFSFSVRNQLTKNNYFTSTINGGIAPDDISHLIKFGKYNTGLSFSYGYDSPIGPILLTLAKNFNRSDIFGHISIGYPF